MKYYKTNTLKRFDKIKLNTRYLYLIMKTVIRFLSIEMCQHLESLSFMSIATISIYYLYVACRPWTSVSLPCDVVFLTAGKTITGWQSWD